MRLLTNLKTIRIMLLSKKLNALFAQNPVTIFIVDDNEVFVRALKADIETTFIKMPLTIHSFTDGESCMRKISEEKPQVVILDYHLNGNNPKAVDGITILARIKKENEETNVIILTGDDHIDIAIKSFKHGASDYIVKTETQSQKIKYSLINIFKIIEAKSEAKGYQHLLIAGIVAVSLMVGGFAAALVFAPWVFK